MYSFTCCAVSLGHLHVNVFYIIGHAITFAVNTSVVLALKLKHSGKGYEGGNYDKRFLY